MILKALYDYYQRKLADPNSHIAPEGWELKAIPYRIVINKEGGFVAVEDMREGEGKNKRAKQFLVPQSVKRTVGKNANLLWDNIEYALGANPRDRDDVEERFNLFKEKIKREINIEEFMNVKYLINFLDNNPVRQIEVSGYSELWNKILEENPFIVFKIEGENHASICDEITKATGFDSQNEFEGVCLITGNKSNISRVHPSIKGVRGGNTQGGALLSFNLPPFNSYGKKQNYNSPISLKATFAYTTALNNLLVKDSKNKITIGDSTLVFWAEKSTDEANPEEVLPWVIAFQKTEEYNPDKGVNIIQSFINSIYTGQRPVDKTNHFYVLGLSPNAARISVRFWKAPSVEEFGRNIKKHFDDFEIVHREYEPKYLSLYEILSSISTVTNKRDKPNIIFFRGQAYDVIPNLSGQLVEAIIDGSQYPLTLVQQCIIRMRAEASKKDKNGKSIPNVTYPRAAIIKAYLNRFNRIHKQNQKEITMALDKNNANVGYLLGRLFSVIERAQFVSNNYKEPNAGIRDRFFGSFSSSPISVLPIIEKLYGHHLKKIKNAQKFFESKLLEENKKEIIDKLDPLKIPAHLTLQQQALFSIGYYHQKQELESIKSNKKENQSITNQLGA